MNFLLVVFLISAVCDGVVWSQCYIDSDIAIHWFNFHPNAPFQEDSNQCLANYTIFNENRVDDTPSQGVTCSRKNSIATDGTWTYDGNIINCTSGETSRCVRAPGSITIYTIQFGSPPRPNGIYTCCIEGLCISIRIYHSDDLRVVFPDNTINDATIESCSVIPPSDFTVIPQQYTVKMVTSEVPPNRLISKIDCTSNCAGATFGESYYELIDLTEERYQYSRPVTWNPDTSNTNPQYRCSAVFGESAGGNTLSNMPTTSIRASNAPTDTTYEVINATAIKIQWDISGNVNGFLIKITSSGLPIVTQQLTDGIAREVIYNDILPERNYTVEVRGYDELLGLADTVTIRLEAGISSVNSSLLSVSDDLSTQRIQVNCYTFRVEPDQVTWSIDSVSITQDSSYQPVYGSKLLDSTSQTYRHYIIITGSFNNGTAILCHTTVNGETETETYVLQVASSPPGKLSATIVSFSSVLVSWNPLSDVTGYIIQYTPGGQPELLNGTDASNNVLRGLIQGTTYQINVYSYKDLPSESSSDLSVLWDVPIVTSVNIQPKDPTSVVVSWDTSNSIINDYTVLYTQLCDNMKGTIVIENGTLNSLTIENLYPGFQYSVGVTPLNIFGKGMEVNGMVTLEGTGPPTGAPLLMKPVVISSTAVRLSWEEVNCAQRNGSITGYSIKYFTHDEPQQPIVHNVTGTTTNTTISDLTEVHSVYYISIAAINNNGIGPYSQELSFFTIDTSISGLLITTSTRFVNLRWQPLMAVTNVIYTYEVAYISRPDNTECSGDLTTLPDGYTVYPVNTSSNNIEVFDLMPDTCYIFGVRVHVSIANTIGEFSLIWKATISEDISLSDQQSSSTSVQLSWTPLITQTDDSFTYEVGYISQPSNTACTSTSLTTLPEGYTSFVNTTNSSVVVTGLDSGTCYLFGVRVYSSRSPVPGEWTLLLQQTDTTALTTSPSIGGIVGGTVAGVLIVILAVILTVIVIIFLFRSKRKSKLELLSKENCIYYNEADTCTKNKPEQEYVEYTEMDTTQMKQHDNLYSTVDSTTPNYEAVTGLYGNTTDNGSSTVYYNQASPSPPFDPMIPEKYPIPVIELGPYVSEKHFGMNTGFKDEFETLYTGEEKSCVIGQRDEHKLLNRFKNITVYDDNRILLRHLPGKDVHNEFINASFVDGYSSPRKYIATQGPLLRTVGDFWHMVWQEKVQFIVMLTNLMEEKKKKCARYWPEELNSSKTYGHFNVTHLEEEPLLHFVIRTLRVELMGTTDSVIVKHYQYTTWPDYGVPESVSPFMTLNRRVMNFWSKDKGPILVHCSAGVGRTGTFIAVDMALEQAKKEGKVDIAGIVCKLRQQRTKMVQTDAQYAFIHDTVLEAVVAGSTEIPVELFEAKLMKWRQPRSETGTTSIQTQFELLDLVTPSQDDVMKHTAEKFPEKNRSMKFLPSEKWRVSLKGEVPDYIHATSIYGYREKKAFIIAQSPMKNTVRDFWKMIMDNKVSAIVMCCREQEKGREVCFPYWNQDSPLRFDNLIVEVKSVTEEANFIQRDLQVNDNLETYMNVAHFQLTDWPESGVLKSPKAILDVQDNIGRVQRKSGKGPVVVHCSDTVGRSGIFCAASNAIEQCKTEGLVDVFQATKAVRMHKPGAVTSLEQYNFIHEIMVCYVMQNSAYSNFQMKDQ